MQTFIEIFNGELGSSARGRLNRYLSSIVSGSEGINAIWNAISGLRAEMQALDGGVGGLITDPSYDPSDLDPYKSATLIALGKGTFTHFKDSSGVSITVTQDNSFTIFFRGAGESYWNCTTTVIAATIDTKALSGISDLTDVPVVGLAKDGNLINVATNTDAVYDNKNGGTLSESLHKIFSVVKGFIRPEELDSHYYPTGYYVVTNEKKGDDVGNFCMGLLEVFSDSMRHLAYQRLTINCKNPNESYISFKESSAPKTWERIYNISAISSSGVPPKGTWSAWIDISTETLVERVERSVRLSELGSYFTSDEFMDCVRSGDVSVYGRWKVTDVCFGIDVAVGVVDVFVDSMLHCLTQRLLTNMVVNDSGELDGNTHNHSLHEYYRLYNLSWTEEKLPDGSSWPLNSWSAWKDDLGGLLSSVEELRKSTTDDIARLNELTSNLSSNLPRVINKTVSSSDVSLALSNGEEDLGTDTIIEAATPTQAGVMSAQDKIDINNLKDNVDELTKQLYEIYTVYGIEFDTAISSPTCTRIGRLDLHRTLPIQSKMRGCLLDDDGNVVKYLDQNDWTSEDRTGSSGQVMVEIPMHYRRFDTDGTKRRVYISELSFPGCEVVPKAYVSAYEATLQRSTSKLCSVVNDDADYRGGNNNANWDGTYRSLLGRPASIHGREKFRSYARNRKSGNTEWNCYTYDIHKTLFWLFAIEYATLNSQTAYNSEPTSEGYRQGGLGTGVTCWDYRWHSFNINLPFVPCGHTDSFGNRTGIVSYTAENDDKSISKTFNVPRYRGIENPFGHVAKWIDGCSIQVSASQENGGTGLSKAFICHNPAYFQDTNYDNYSYVGDISRVYGFIKEVLFGVGGEILPKLTGGSSTTYFSDGYSISRGLPTSDEKLYGLIVGGSTAEGSAESYGWTAGFVYATLIPIPIPFSSNYSSRLCFIPSEE